MGFYKEEGGKLVPTSGVPQEAALSIERADDATIVEYLSTGFGTENFMYHYPIKGGDVYGIGVDGAKEIARLLGNIEVLPDIKVDKDSEPDYIYAMVRAKNLVNNVTLVGVGRQCKYYLTEGNIPTDRINEYAFVIAMSKAQRNAILSVAPQETIQKIIQAFMEQKKIKKVPPAYGKPAPAKAKGPPAETKAEEAATAEKKLRQQVGIEAGKVFKTDEERKAWQKSEYGVDSMTDLTEEQLREMLAKVKAMAHAGPTPEELGFSSKAEQDQMRKELFTKLLPELGCKSDDEKKQYLKGKGAKATTQMTKEELQNLMEEVKGEIKLAEEAEQIPDEA